ncbi:MULTISPECIES: alpha/beta hydrolase [Mycobacteriaceae]|uniref:Lysophospholipase n=1 Tax=Mycolicibacterium parafortuitum TaxID=39692 RepID=A0ACC6MD04_MYCPF|nr:MULTISPECIES: alpha/beta fold hydrolase [Mycobacteriaceae]MDZ5084836.1 lysophospholipase [Mycolicibacterium parafortuitum]GFM26537.1 putative lysophospholipase [Mycobacterium sp. PO2]
MLEVIVKGAATEAHPAPLVFVHGAWHGAWCWDEHFLDYFAELGYACHAPSLRGHGASSGGERLRWHRVADYVRDLADLVDQLPASPVLIGHSMGGFVVQKYLERHRAEGAVLLASVPPTGAVGATMRIARHHPVQFLRANAMLRLAPLVATPELAHQLFFSAATAHSDVDRYQRRMQDESYRAFLDMLVLDRVRSSRVAAIPMLVLGADADTIIARRDVRQTAATYGVKPEFFADTGHDLMLEPQWPKVAQRIAEWLAAQSF